MAKHKEWKEGELVLTFGLTKKLFNDPSPLMIEWQSVEAPPFTTYEQYIFDETYAKGVAGINGWSEEDLKMKFISLILILGKLTDSGRIVTFFDKKLSGIVEGITLSVKTDFMVAKGLMDMFQTPFFHFQEYKPQKNPTGDPMAQLLEAFLIAQAINNAAGKYIPLYGCEVIGKQWTFVIMDAKTYWVSKSYDCTDRDDLLKIIAMLRKFREIVETRFLD